eukprot:CAMPEP_0170190958 /NCGR_PEP_ID=MMETSP0040_2-20121228/50549_1 /TAXON_ID=641309 /ORGANISM="Lotharella oceanica, Strain CCMP622" /LENGTH=312 /DNA_ID=CAMNT_0010438929 /DNA_START=67 /DNA_END=1006 /DNA_ORIENTATION=-
MTRNRKTDVEAGSSRQDDASNLSYQDMLNEPPPWRNKPARPGPGDPPRGYHYQPGGYAAPDAAPEPAIRKDNDEGCCMTCAKGFVVILLIGLILAAGGYFGYSFFKEKFFPDEEKPYQYDPSKDPFGEYSGYNPYANQNPYGGSAAAMARQANPVNTHPGEVLELRSLEELQTELSHPGLVIVEFITSRDGYCKQIDPVYQQLASVFPQAVFLRVNLDKVDMEGEVNEVPTYYFFCMGNPYSILEMPTAEELRKTSVEAIRVCGQNMAMQALAVGSGGIPADPGMGGGQQTSVSNDPTPIQGTKDDESGIAD